MEENIDQLDHNIELILAQSHKTAQIDERKLQHYSSSGFPGNRTSI